MAAVAAALLHPLQQQVVSSVLRALQQRLRYFFVSKETSAQMGGLMDNLRVENLEFDASNLTRELQRFEIPLSAVGGSIKCVEVRLYLSHARLDIIATGCCLTLMPNDLQQTNGPTLDVITKRLEEVQSHIAQFHSMQQVLQLQQQLDRLERLLQLEKQRKFGEPQQWQSGSGSNLQNQYKGLLERQRRASASVETPMQALLQWLLRYLPNVNLRIDGLNICIDDTAGFFGPPATLDLTVKRIILQPSVVKVPWGFTWPCNTPTKNASGSGSSTSKIHLGPQKCQHEEKNAFAVDINVYDMSIVMKRRTNSHQHQNSNQLQSDILEAADFSLQVYLQTEKASQSRSKTGIATGEMDEVPQQWRLYVHIVGEKPVKLSLDSFAILYLASMRLKIKQTTALSGINIYKPRVRPNKDPRSWWRFARTHAHLLTLSRPSYSSFCAEVNEKISHMKRFIRLMKRLILKHEVSGVVPNQRSQQGDLDVRVLFKPVVARYLEQQHRLSTESNTPIGSHGDDDDTFLLLQISRRPYSATAQWTMIAAKELAFAKQQLLLREDPDMVDWTSLDDHLQRLHQRRIHLLEQTTRGDSTHGQFALPQLPESVSELKALEDEACDIRRQMQQTIERCHQSLISYFETPSEFCKQARNAAIELEKSRRQLQLQLHQHQSQHLPPGSSCRRGTAVYQVFERQEAVAAAATADLLHAQRKVWERSRERLMVWAIFFAVYRQLFPSVPLASVKAETMEAVLEQHALQQLEAGFFSTCSSKGSRSCTTPLQVKPAVRINRQTGGNSSRPAQQEFPSPISAVPQLLMRLRSGVDLPVPWWLQRLRFGVLLRRLAVRLAPHINPKPVQSLEENFEEGSERQWLSLEITDGAVEFSSAGEISVLACFRAFEVFLCSGKSIIVSGGTCLPGNGLASRTHEGPVWKSEFSELCRELLLKLAHGLRGDGDGVKQSLTSDIRVRSDMADQSPKGTGTESSSNPHAQPHCDGEDSSLGSGEHADVGRPGRCRRTSLWEDALDVVGKAATAAAAAAATAADVAVAAVVADGDTTDTRSYDNDQAVRENEVWRLDRSLFEPCTLGESIPKRNLTAPALSGCISSSNRPVNDRSGLHCAKEAFQLAVRQRHSQEQALSGGWNFFLMQLVSAAFARPNQQRPERLRVGVPLYLRISGHLQHLSGDFKVDHLEKLRHQVEQLMVILCGATLSSRTDIGLGASDGASGTVSFFCNLLSNYERHNTTQLYRYRLELQKHKRQLQHKKQQKQSPDAVCGGTTQPDCHEVKDDGTLGGSNMPACSVSAECDEDGSFEFPFHAPHDVTYTGARHAVSRDSLTTDIEGNFDATLSAPKLPVTVDLSFVTERLGAALRIREQRQQKQSTLWQYIQPSGKKIKAQLPDSLHDREGNAGSPEEIIKSWRDILGLIVAKVRLQLPSVDLVLRASQGKHHNASPLLENCNVGENTSAGDAQSQYGGSAVKGCLGPSAAVIMRIRLPTQTVSAIQTSRRNGSEPATSVCHISLGSVGSVYVPCSCSVLEILPWVLPLLRTHFHQLNAILQLVLPRPSKPLAEVMTTLEQRMNCSLGQPPSSPTSAGSAAGKVAWTQQVLNGLSKTVEEVEHQEDTSTRIDTKSHPVVPKRTQSLLCLELFRVSSEVSPSSPQNADGERCSAAGSARCHFEPPGNTAPFACPKPAEWKEQSKEGILSGTEVESKTDVELEGKGMPCHGEGATVEDSTGSSSASQPVDIAIAYPEALRVRGSTSCSPASLLAAPGSCLPMQAYEAGAVRRESPADPCQCNGSVSNDPSIHSHLRGEGRSDELPTTTDLSRSEPSAPARNARAPLPSVSCREATQTGPFEMSSELVPPDKKQTLTDIPVCLSSSDTPFLTSPGSCKIKGKDTGGRKTSPSVGDTSHDHHFDTCVSDQAKSGVNDQNVIRSGGSVFLGARSAFQGMQLQDSRHSLLLNEDASGPKDPCSQVMRSRRETNELQVEQDANKKDDNRKHAEEGLTNMGLRRVRGSDAFRLYS